MGKEYWLKGQLKKDARVSGWDHWGQAWRVVGEGAQPSPAVFHPTLWLCDYRAFLGIHVHREHDHPMSYRMAKALVFTKIKNSLGLDHCRIFISGAAPLNQETSEFFLSLDIPIGEVYGMSESSGPHTISTPANYKFLRYRSPGQTPGPLATLGQSGRRWEGFWDMMNPDLVPPASRLQIFMTVGSPSLSESPRTKREVSQTFYVCTLPICHL